MEVISDKIWLLLYYWYSNMTVRIRHRNSLSEQIKVGKRNQARRANQPPPVQYVLQRSYSRTAGL